MNKNVSSAYIHIPFCRTICSYCDFCKFFYNEKIVDEYLKSLRKEIEKRYKKDKLKTIYIGGGTPSCLSLKQLKELFQITKNLILDKYYEFTIEANINDISEEKLKLFKENGINRISIGIETVNKKYMPFLNRYNDKEDIINKIILVKKYFDNFNLDLMYAFPNQTIEEVLEDLDFVSSLSPTHISIYSLIIEEHTKIYIDKVKPIDEELESKMYYKIIEYLEKKNYSQYEISNFAKKGYESKHNLVYWNNEHYYGFGLSASGYIDNIRYTNNRNILKYNNENYIYEKEEITKQIDMENELILGLRKREGIDKRVFLSKYSSTIEDNFDIIELKKNGLLEEDNNMLKIPLDKLYVSNSILVNFIGGSIDEGRREN